MYYAIASFLWKCLQKGMVEGNRVGGAFHVAGCIIEHSPYGYFIRDISGNGDEYQELGGIINKDPRKDDDQSKVAILLLSYILINTQYPEGELRKSILSSLKRKHQKVLTIISNQ